MPYSHLQPTQSQTQPFFAEQPLMSAAASNVTSMLNVQEPRLGMEDVKHEKFDLDSMNKGTFNFDPQPLDSMGSLNLNNLASQIVKHHPRPSAVSSFNARTIDYGGGFTLWSRRQDNLRLLLTKTFLSQAASSFMSPSLASATATSSNCLNSFGALAHPSNYHNHFFHSQHQHPHQPQPQLQPHPSLQYQQHQQQQQQFLPVNECPVKSEPMSSQSTSFFPNGSSTNTADELKKSLKRSLSSGLKHLSNKVALTSTDMTSGEQQPDALNNDVKSHHGKVKRKLISNAHSPSPPYSACSSTSSASSSSNYVSTTSSSASSINNNQPSTAAFNNLLSNSKCFDYSK